MIEPPVSATTVPFDEGIDLTTTATAPASERVSREAMRQRLKETVRRIAKRQRLLFADGRFAVLIVLQGLDAAGKDSTVRAVLSRVNPAGCRVHSFGVPSDDERRHDFLWRVAERLPARGMIGVFNRSHYEEVLIARVHPELLKAQRLPSGPPDDAFWRQRLEAIRGFERHLANEGTVILKFWLHVSADEQRRRFLRRLEHPKKYWKFDDSDVRERRFRANYLRAAEQALSATSRPWAPWYVIPADDKPWMRQMVGDILRETLDALPLEWPSPDGDEEARLARIRRTLEDEEGPV
jgi:PPK2 family polyphosphate:nucleotide phosphotransferase